MGDIALLFFKVIVFIIVFVCILFIAYISTKFIGKRTSQAMKGKNIEILESISLGIDKSLYLVKVGEKCFVISISGKMMNYITDVDLEDIDFSKDNSESTNSTSDFYNTLMKHLKFNKGQKNENKNSDNSIKNNISKIKNSMKKFQGSGDEKNHE